MDDDPINGDPMRKEAAALNIPRDNFLPSTSRKSTEYRFVIFKLADVFATGQPVFSDRFSADDSGSLVFQMVFEPRPQSKNIKENGIPSGQVDANQKSVITSVDQDAQIKLRLVKFEETNMTINFRMAVLDKHKQEVKLMTREGSFLLNPDVLWEGVSMKLSRETLLNPAYQILPKAAVDLAGNCLPPASEEEKKVFGSLTLLAVIRIGDLIKDHSDSCKDYQNMLTTGQNSDFAFKVYGVRFPVHKAVVSERSSGLSQLIIEHLAQQADNPEPDNCLELHCIGLNVMLMKQILHFIYCGDFKDQLELIQIPDLLEADSQYNIKGLKQRCADFLVKSLDMSMAGTVLDISVPYQLRSVEDAVADLLAANIDKMDEKKWTDICRTFSPASLRDFKKEVRDRADRLANKEDAAVPVKSEGASNNEVIGNESSYNVAPGNEDLGAIAVAAAASANYDEQQRNASICGHSIRVIPLGEEIVLDFIINPEDVQAYRVVEYNMIPDNNAAAPALDLAPILENGGNDAEMDNDEDDFDEDNFDEDDFDEDDFDEDDDENSDENDDDNSDEDDDGNSDEEDDSSTDSGLDCDEAPTRIHGRLMHPDHPIFQRRNNVNQRPLGYGAVPADLRNQHNRQHLPALPVPGPGQVNGGQPMVNGGRPVFPIQLLRLPLQSNHNLAHLPGYIRGLPLRFQPYHLEVLERNRRNFQEELRLIVQRQQRQQENGGHDVGNHSRDDNEVPAQNGMNQNRNVIQNGECNVEARLLAPVESDEDDEEAEDEDDSASEEN